MTDVRTPRSLNSDTAGVLNMRLIVIFIWGWSPNGFVKGRAVCRKNCDASTSPLLVSNSRGYPCFKFAIFQ